ncbi:flagellar basal body rod protein FlgB [Sporolactobacillus sp. STSJ-5]|uniref:flagellar basal body rod protein FlgB n=1 Tax=Sporolactobacillus sp. STSJ-5 TaxID=2965076 RepID=UPI002104E5D9|nr:flagellar basal body rod protein FlgB [Sporolactobacillus sp. STSJ-5]MCQ2008943.1 flagellar basal body rod protein FlgB [Sporolactobacillus sp. STSJ-5]
MFSVTPLNAIERALNGSMAEQNAIAQNIANVDTPNYKAQKVTFNDVLQTKLKANRTDESQIDFSSSEDSGYRTVTDNYGSVQNNGNNVDLDHEMSELAQNQLLYQTLSQAASDQFKKFNIVLGGS